MLQIPTLIFEAQVFPLLLMIAYIFQEEEDTQVNAKFLNISEGSKPLFDDSEIEYLEYKNYLNLNSNTNKKVLRRDKKQLKPRGQEKDHLKIKQSISKKMCSMSIFAKNKEKRLNFRKTLSSMVVSMMNIF